jgi:hypothetical protein
VRRASEDTTRWLALTEAFVESLPDDQENRKRAYVVATELKECRAKLLELGSNLQAAENIIRKLDTYTGNKIAGDLSNNEKERSRSKQSEAMLLLATAVRIAQNIDFYTIIEHLKEFLWSHGINV